MVKDAEAHEAEDKKRREEVERRNKLDNLCYNLEKQLADNKDKLAGAASEIEALVKEGREAIEKQDDEKVASVTERLEKKAYEVAQKLYESDAQAGGAAAGAAPGAGAAPDSGKKGDVIDAEFEESN